MAYDLLRAGFNRVLKLTQKSHGNEAHMAARFPDFTATCYWEGSVQIALLRGGRPTYFTMAGIILERSWLAKAILPEYPQGLRGEFMAYVLAILSHAQASGVTVCDVGVSNLGVRACLRGEPTSLRVYDLQGWQEEPRPHRRYWSCVWGCRSVRVLAEEVRDSCPAQGGIPDAALDLENPHVWWIGATAYSLQ